MNYYFFIIKYIINKEKKLNKYIQEKMKLKRNIRNEYLGLISFRIVWFVLLAETLKGLLQNHSSKASILQHSAFFMVQLSHPYVTPGKTIALARWTFFHQSDFSAFYYAI